MFCSRKMVLQQVIIALVFILLPAYYSHAQCPTTDVNLSTQAQVNAFPATYPGCTVIPDGINVEIMGNNITHLDSLAQLTAIYGAVEVRDCPLLVDLDGLHNLTVIGNDSLDGFILRDLPLLNTIAALHSLTSITGEFTIRTCEDLPTLTGLNNLKEVNGSVIIRDNAVLENLNGLDSLHYIGETLEIVENPELTSVAALSNVDTIVGGPEGGIFIEANVVLTNLLGLAHDSTVVGGNLDLLFNFMLNMCAVPVICNYLANPPAGATISIAGNLTGCNSQAEIIADCAFVGVEQNEVGENQWLVTPNPVTEQFQIVAPFKWHTVEILDVNGKQVQIIHASDGPVFSLNAKPGVYYFMVRGNEGEQRVMKVVK